MQAVQLALGVSGAPTVSSIPVRAKREKESIHSGHFMVSDFEAEEQDDEDEVAVPIPEAPIITEPPPRGLLPNDFKCKSNQQLAIDTSLAKLFQCMSLAYRQKLTSPKWNRFRGIRLRWKDKIRLNNVIWRCWHLQFIKKENTLICQFASPLDVDTHNKPEAVVLEGKYWKRKLAAVTAEYKKWRMFYRNHALGQTIKDDIEMLSDADLLTWNTDSIDDVHMMVDEDYMGLMSDTLFSTITNQPFVFPDTREIAKAGLADFIQPSLGPLQPNLDDYMDTFEPLQEFMSGKLPTVPEEQPHTWSFGELELIAPNETLQQVSSRTITPVVVDQYHQQGQNLPQLARGLVVDKQQLPIENNNQQNVQQSNVVYQNDLMLPNAVEQFVQQIPQPPPPPPPPPYHHHTVISKNAPKTTKESRQQRQQPPPPPPPPRQPPSPQKINIYNYNNAEINERLQPIAVEEVAQFKMLPDQRQGYKFTAPAVPNLKFTSQVPPHMMYPPAIQPSSVPLPQYHMHSLSQKEETKVKGATRGRPRSRSNTREPIKRPPLISAVSDPSLLSQTSNSVLLTQLLTSNTDNLSSFTRNQTLIGLNDQIPKQQIRIKEENNPIPILPQPTLSPTHITLTPIITSAQSTSSTPDPLLLNSFSSSNSPILDSSQGINSPTSSQSSIGSPNRDTPYREQRRVGHIHAEQKRRYNIKNGFDMLHSLIPHLNQNPNAKLSKAAMLQKGAEYIRQLRSERNQLREEMDCLRQQIETLNTSISNCQSMLPATGAPVSRRKDSKMQEMFDEYVKNRTMENWKFWIFSLLFRPLLLSFNNFVSTTSLDDLYRSTMLWIEQHCTLVDLRPVVLNSLRYLCKKTDILTEPEKLSDETRQIVLSKSQQK